MLSSHSHSHFSALDLANTLWALGKMGSKPPQRVMALFEVYIAIYEYIHTYILHVYIYTYIHTYIHHTCTYICIYTYKR